MNKEWQDLPNLFDVCTAQADGWEIIVSTGEDAWCPWGGTSWFAGITYRGRPKRPKTKTVKFLCYSTNFGLEWQQEGQAVGEFCNRFPAGDIEGEVEV